MTICTCKFETGQIIFHKRHGYRGVIYDVDDSCHEEEEETSEEENRPLPRRDQPWYHVLVDGEEHTTYVAEENIERDETPTPIDHPLLDEYFIEYQAGKYQRNFDA